MTKTRQVLNSVCGSGARARQAWASGWRLLRLIAPCLAIGLLVAAEPAHAQQAEQSWTERMFGFFELTPEQERQVAEQEHPKIVEQFGGVYEDPELDAYLQELVTELGKQSERPDITYRVTLLNSPIVNAFALPAGYLYITRGLLALAANEAELAGVLAHEIGHVTARHSARRYGRAAAAQIGVGLLGVLSQAADLGQFGQVLGQAAQLGALAYVQGFSREQEFEADTLGIATLSRTDYDPQGMASFLDKLGDNTRLQMRLMGRPENSADQFNLLATHPRTSDRVQRAIENARLQGVNAGSVVRDEYLLRLNGLLYEDDPAQGFVRGRRFAHPELMMEFVAPEDFRLLNSAEAVTGYGPDGAGFKFDAAAVGDARDMVDYLTRLWAPSATLQGVEAFDLNGLDAATGFTQITQGRQRIDLRLVAIQWDDKQVFRFLYHTVPENTLRLAEAFRETTFSFRRLSEAEAAALKPLEIRIHTVKAGETADELAKQWPYESFQEDRFRVLNGLGPDQDVVEGQLVKMVVERGDTF
ncbi:MAG: M48 family metalloprotease [Alphaproteobacteria bacterium]|nr:M48 family metalloprotease [Alphaproteobacteria bacterium]